MKNTLINREVIKKVARALGDLNERVVYVGGAVVSLYVDDPAADDIRPTKDLDISMEIASLGALEKLRVELLKKKFVQKSADKVQCRFHYQDVQVDVMATEEIGWAPADRWFKPGFDHLIQEDIDGQKIRILSLSYFLATKFSAYNDRGKGDPRTSHDFEDIVYILDNQSELVKLIQESPDDVKIYLKEEFRKILGDSSAREAIYGNLFFETQETRNRIVLDKLKAVVENHYQ